MAAESPARPSLRRPFGWLRELVQRAGGKELSLLLIAAAFAFVTALFLDIAGDVLEGDTQSLDEHIVRALRRSDDPGIPIGPRWLRTVGMDVTALGSITVLVMVSLGAIGYLAIHRKWRLIWIVSLTTGGGIVCSHLLKHLFGRMRPSVVPHLSEVSTPSFPSGHAALSAVVYLTLGALLMRVSHGTFAKLYCLAAAVFLSFIIGVSRVYLGVHYPTDVAAGWLFGILWALMAWLVVRYLEVRAKRRSGEAAVRARAGSEGASATGGRTPTG